jgi:glucose-6-phosphate dehydrogenase assembly protein OpcA
MWNRVSTWRKVVSEMYGTSPSASVRGQVRPWAIPSSRASAWSSCLEVLASRLVFTELLRVQCVHPRRDRVSDVRG